LNKKAFPLILTLVIALMIALTGCGSSDDASESGDSSSSGKEKTIELMHLWPEGSSKQHNEIVKGIISEYEEANPGIKIETEILGNEQYKEKLKVLAASNELPDVGMTWAGGFLDPYVGGNMFAPLDDVIEADKFVPGTTEAYAVDGKTYGLPLELNITPVYYNKAKFEKYNLEVPETLDEMKEVVKTLRLCVICNEFKQYILKDKNTLWLFFKCSSCDAIIKIPRERNRAANKWEKEKWK